jgi:hypothetical protein
MSILICKTYLLKIGFLPEHISSKLENKKLEVRDKKIKKVLK